MAKKQKTEAKKPRKKKDAPVTRPESYTFQHKFSEEELRAKSRQLAEAVAAKTETEDKKKSVVSDFKAKIDSHTATINLLSQNINSGQETITRTCECTRDFNRGVKTYKYDGKVVGEEKMMESEFQLQIDTEAEEGRKATVDASGVVVDIEQPKKKRGGKKKEEVVDLPFEDGEREVADVPFEGTEDSLDEDEQ